MNYYGPPPQAYWTDEMVFAYVQKAADICRKLPRPKPQGYFNTWPLVLYDLMEILQADINPARANRTYATPREVTFHDYVCTWFNWCNADEIRVIWRRAEGRPWKVIEHELKISESTGRRRQSYGLMKIVAKLNAHDPEGVIIKQHPTYHDVDLKGIKS